MWSNVWRFSRVCVCLWTVGFFVPQRYPSCACVGREWSRLFCEGSCAAGTETRSCHSGNGRPCCHRGRRACPVITNTLSVDVFTLGGSRFFMKMPVPFRGYRSRRRGYWDCHRTDLARVDLGVAEGIVVGTHVDGCCDQLYLLVSGRDDVGSYVQLSETVPQARCRCATARQAMCAFSRLGRSNSWRLWPVCSLGSAAINLARARATFFSSSSCDCEFNHHASKRRPP